MNDVYDYDNGDGFMRPMEKIEHMSDADFLINNIEPYDPSKESNYISPELSFTVEHAISNLGHKIYNLRTRPGARPYHIYGVWSVRKYGTDEIIEAVYINPYEEMVIIAGNKTEAGNIFKRALLDWFHDYRLQHKEDFIQVYVKKEARDLLDLAVKNS